MVREEWCRLYGEVIPSRKIVSTPKLVTNRRSKSPEKRELLARQARRSFSDVQKLRETRS